MDNSTNLSLAALVILTALLLSSLEIVDKPFPSRGDIVFD